METWLVRARQRRLPALTEEELYDHTLWGALQMLRSGTTSMLDHFPLERSREDFGVMVAAQAYLDSGMSAALCLTVNDQSRFVYGDDEAFLTSLPSSAVGPARGLYRPFDAERYFDTWDRMNEALSAHGDRIRLGFGPSGPQWCSDALLLRLRETASANEMAPIQIHLLESKYQAMYGDRVYRASVVEHLEGLGFFNGTGVSCAHCVWCSETELASLARLGATLVHNPSSNLQLQVGMVPIIEAMEHGVRVGLGCDAGGFEEDLDILLEARLCRTSQTPSTWAGASLDSGQLLQMLTTGSIDSLGLGALRGRLEPGHRADIVLIDDGGLHDNPYGSVGLSPADLVVGRARAEDVSCVVAGGERTVVDGVFVSADEEALRTRVSRTLERYTEAILDADGDFELIEPYVVAFYEDWERESVALGNCLGHPSPLR